MWLAAAVAAPADVPEVPAAGGPAAPYLGSCARDPVETCYDFYGPPSGRADAAARCELVAGVFGRTPCTTDGETGRCELPGSVTRYYGRTTTRMFGVDEPVDALCVHDGGRWVAAARVTFRTVDGRVTLETPAGWVRNPRTNPYDLQVLAPDQRSNTGLFVYPPEDLAAGTTAAQLLERQVADLRSKRANFEVVAPLASERLADRTVVSAVYAGEKEGARSYYRFVAVDFDREGSPLVAALQVAIPSEWATAGPVLDALARSIALATPAPAAAPPPPGP